MKPATAAALLGVFILLMGTLLMFLLSPSKLQAAGVGGDEQYKVVRTVDLGGEERIEQVLNKFGSEGWKVRTCTGSFVIMAK